MDKQLKNIEIGIGIGSIRFGMKRDEVKAILGEPDEIEVFEEEDPELDNTIVWHFDEVEMSLSFGDDDMLLAIAISNEDVMLAGKKLMGLTINEITEFVKEFDLGEMEIEEQPEEDGVKSTLVSLWESAMNLWFEDDELTEIQWGPLWDEETLN
ncbi:MAG: hypothetical protein CVU09_06955 [Bacteroidetes bacterium HGW-Bacteroidetes-4]|jgi:hypothetical protein|nr:MAG: hypothetical protein CVU09_06955 [Bacteroidetes bacterium HGW-Bacteroidetes-4]